MWTLIHESGSVKHIFVEKGFFTDIISLGSWKLLMEYGKIARIQVLVGQFGSEHIYMLDLRRFGEQLGGIRH
jgi:hypothetical protein